MSAWAPLQDVAERLQRLGDDLESEGRGDDAIAAYAGALSLYVQISRERGLPVERPLT